jgi:hypothetical protein
LILTAILHNRFWPILIWIGLLLFCVFFILGAAHYPGGSNANAQAIGYDWSTNYWSELLGENAKNGKVNAARPYGFAGMFIFASTMSLFWYKIPNGLQLPLMQKKILQLTGVSSMVSSVFIFGQAHDVLITFAVTFGSIAFFLTLIGLWRNKNWQLFGFCLVCLMLILLNTAIYLSDWMISILPVLQKITFSTGIIWTGITAWGCSVSEKQGKV